MNTGLNETLSTKDLSNLLSKVEDIKANIYHVKSLADLLVCKFQELTYADRLKSDEFSDPILSIAEMLREKADATLKTIEDIEEIYYAPCISTLPPMANA